jgi:hypothetical protein
MSSPPADHGTMQLPSRCNDFVMAAAALQFVMAAAAAAAATNGVGGEGGGQSSANDAFDTGMRFQFHGEGAVAQSPSSRPLPSASHQETTEKHFSSEAEPKFLSSTVKQGHLGGSL